MKQVLRTLAMVERVLHGGVDGAVYLLRMRPYRTTDNVIDGVVLTFIDITERQQHEYERGRLAAIVESSQDAIIGHTLEGVITLWNGGAERMFGYSASRAIGKSLAILLPPLDANPDLRTLLAACSGESHAHDEMMTSWLRQDGLEVPVSVRCSPVLDQSGAVIGGSTIVRDISERKRAARRLQESERRLADIVEQATVGVAQTDLDGHLEMVNPRFCEMVGRTAEDLRGMRMQAITHVDDVVENDRMFRALLASGEPFQTEKRFLRPDGRSIWVSNHVSLIHDDHGRPTSAVAVVLDITQRKLASEHRELLLDELNHRVKNTLATVQAIAMQTLTHASDLGGFREAFLSRLQSLSNTHNLLADQSWRGARIGDLVRAEVAPYATTAGPHVRAHGDDVELTARQSLAISLALHELVTNASKYGAFSKPDGRVDIHWNIDIRDNMRWLRLQWEERDGPEVKTPERRGFGTRLITDGVKHDLDGRVFLDFPATGVVCIIEFPLKDQDHR